MASDEFLRTVLYRAIATLVFCTFSCLAAIGQSVQLPDNEEKLTVGLGNMQWYRDASRSYTIENIATAKFTVAQQDVPTFGYTDDNIWVRIEVNHKANDLRKWWLHYHWVFADTVEFYSQSTDGSWQMLHQAGFDVPFFNRPVSISTLAFPLDFTQKNKQTFYLRINATAPVALPMHLITDKALLRQSQKEDILYGLYFGALIIILVYNLLLGLSLSARSYIYYTLTVLCTLVIFSSITGYTFRWLWPEHPRLNLYLSKIFMGIIVITTSLFASEFLKIRQYARGFRYVFRLMMGLALLSITHVLYDVTSSFSNSLVGVQAILLLAAGIIAWQKGNRAARYYVLAWLLYILGGLLISLANYGLVPYSFFARNAVIIGSLVETFLLSFALADLYRGLQIEKEAAQKDVIEMAQQAQKELEDKVIERTQEISEQNEKLEASAKAIKQQSEDLTRLNDTKSRLLAIIGHDLRSPIHSLLAVLEMMNMKALSQDEILMHAKRIKQDVNITYEMLNNLLQWANNQMQKITAIPHAFNLSIVVKESVWLFKEAVTNKSISLQNNLTNELMVFADIDQIRLVIRNLLSNAVKFTPFEGEIQLSVKLKNSYAELSIRDTGIGIPEQSWEAIFCNPEPMRGTDNEKGTGLGLSLCKDFVEKNNGSIWVESQEGEGSAFFMTLPLAGKSSDNIPMARSSSYSS